MKGFTLVEIIIASTILILLASLSVPLAEIMYDTTKVDEVKITLDDVRAAIEKYKEETGHYPSIQTNETVIEALKRTLVDTGLLRNLPINPVTKSPYDWEIRDSISDIWFSINTIKNNSSQSLPLATAIFSKSEYPFPTNIFDIRFPKSIPIKKETGIYYYEF